MDSVSSGSLQSSSGDEEYESGAAAAAAMSPFMLSNPPSGGHPFLHMTTSNQELSSFPPPAHPPSFPFYYDHYAFSSSSSSFQPLLPLPNPVLGPPPDPVWPRPLLRTDPTSTALAPPPVSSSHLAGKLPPAVPPPPPSSDQTHPTPPRGSRKRTRASRRAPTTVLTTDTSNFRSMVQEFTGIPAAPFSSAAPSPMHTYTSRRLDLFSAAGSAMRSGRASLLPPNPYPYRPSAQNPPAAVLTSAPNSQNLVAPKMNSLFADDAPFMGSKAHHGVAPSKQVVDARRLELDIPGFPVHQTGERSRGAIEEDGGREPRDFVFNDGGNVGISFSASSSGFPVFQADKGTENVLSRPEGTVDSWICNP